MRGRALLLPALLCLAGCGDDLVVAPPDPALPPTALATWGERGPGPGQFYQPTALAVGSDGSVYVIDNQNRRVQKFSNDGEFVRSWGDDPEGEVVLSYLLTAIAVSGDRVYVSDIGTSATHVYTSEGAYLESWDYFAVTSGLAVFPNGDLLLSGYGVLKRGLIVDLLGPFLWRLDPEGREVQRVYQPAMLQVATDRQGNFYGVATKYFEGHPLGFVFKFSPEGHILDRFSVPSESTVYDAVAVDSHGFIYAANRLKASIYKFSPEGDFLVSWSAVGDFDVDLDWPSGLALDRQNNLFVCDFGEDRVVKYGGN